MTVNYNRIQNGKRAEKTQNFSFHKEVKHTQQFFSLLFLTLFTFGIGCRQRQEKRDSAAERLQHEVIIFIVCFPFLMPFVSSVFNSTILGQCGVLFTEKVKQNDGIFFTMLRAKQ
jgi:hypothetical protein